MKFFLLSIALCFVTLKSESQVINLGSACDFVVFSGTGAVSNGGSSNFTGDIGTNTGAISGFGAQVAGTIYNNDAVTQQATIDLWIAYNQIISIPVTNSIHSSIFGSGEILTAGVFFIASAGTLSGNITLDALGDTNAVFIIRFDGAFAMAAGSNVILINGAKPNNVYWVSQAFASGVSCSLRGNYIAHNAAISMNANSNLFGRLLTTCGAISIDNSYCILDNSGSCISNGFPLPIELISFTGHCLSENIMLKWSTASERNNDYFSLERSLDGTSWQIITLVDGAGNSNSIVNYSFIDQELNNSLSYYRLKQTDFDGIFEYSDIIAQNNCSDIVSELTIYPNPTNELLNISFSGDISKFISMSISNVLGEITYYSELYQPKIVVENKINGIYFLHINLESNSINTKFIVNY